MAESHEYDFKHEVNALRVLVGELRAELAAAHAEIAELKARLGETSSNSSRPASSDGYGKPRRVCNETQVNDLTHTHLSDI